MKRAFLALKKWADGGTEFNGMTIDGISLPGEAGYWWASRDALSNTNYVPEEMEENIIDNGGTGQYRVNYVKDAFNAWKERYPQDYTRFKADYDRRYPNTGNTNTPTPSTPAPATPAPNPTPRPAPRSQSNGTWGRGVRNIPGTFRSATSPRPTSKPAPTKSKGTWGQGVEDIPGTFR